MSTLTYIERVSIITLYHVSYVRFRFLNSDANAIILFYDQVAPSTWSESSVKARAVHRTVTGYGRIIMAHYGYDASRTCTVRLGSEPPYRYGTVEIWP
jgi:uncharacterized protein (UPF0128 family)